MNFDELNFIAGLNCLDLSHFHIQKSVSLLRQASTPPPLFFLFPPPPPQHLLSFDLSLFLCILWSICGVNLQFFPMMSNLV